MSQGLNPQLENEWKRALLEEFQKPYMVGIKKLLLQEKKAGYTVYPPGKLIFNAFESTPFSKVKVVILGQDPYHGPHQAHGLCFSVPKGVPPPPSLVNIFAEIQSDLGIPLPPYGELTGWAEQGVFLLNAILTVRANQAASHQDFGWQQFTDAAISKLSTERDHLVFLLWGRYAKSKASLIDSRKHLILTAAHPSPLSAHNGFFGCKHFSRANAYLKKHKIEPIDWNIT